MMELSHSLTLNEAALEQLPPAKKPVFVFEWLRFLNKVLGAANKSDIKGCQKQLVSQLVAQMTECPGPPTRQLIAHALATLFCVGDTFLLFDTINKCNDVLKNKDDSPSYLPTRLASVTCIGAMYEKLGRMMGRSYEETVLILLKTLRNAESQLRIQIMMTLEKLTAGMGTAAANVHKDIYKAAKGGLTDRAMPVRRSAAMCLLELSKHTIFLYTTELENMCQLCYRALETSTSYDSRCSVAKLLGSLLATTQNPSKEILRASSSSKSAAPVKFVSLDEALNLLSTGFLKGGTSFLKGTGEIIKGTSAVPRELRVGISLAYVVFVQKLGSLWLEKNISVLLYHLSDLIASPKATTSHVDAVYSRKCINFIMRSSLGRMLGEKAQTAACKELIHIIIRNMNAIDVQSNDSTGGGALASHLNNSTVGGSGLFSVGELGSQHVLVCMLKELGELVLALSTSCSSIITDPQLNMVDSVMSVLLHPCHSARLAAAWCLQCISVALPSYLNPLLTRCCNKMEALKSSIEAIAGYSSAVAALIGCVRSTPLGIPHVRGKMVFNIAEDLLRSAAQNTRLSLHRTQAGWLIIGALMTLGVSVVKGLLPRMLLLWKNSFPRSNKEIESEKARGDAFTWQVTLEGRAGALSSMYSFLSNCPEVAGEDTIRRLLLPIEAALLMLNSIVNIVKQYGQHLKAAAAMVRLRLYQVLSLLPPQSFEGHYSAVLKLLVSEFTLAESGANTNTSLLGALCEAHHEAVLSPSLHHPDHHIIEEQLQGNSASGTGALEHDPAWLYRAISEDNSSVRGNKEPLPLGVAVIDMSVMLFGQMFPQVAGKNRLKMLNLFIEIIRASKSQRQEAVQTNILTALLIALKKLIDHKGSLDLDEVKKTMTALLMDGLNQTNPVMRCASGEAIGRMAQVVGDTQFVASLAQTSFDKLRSARDATSRTGHSLALGCLHRCVGGMASSHHLSTSISILLALAKDATAPVVQVWALHALSMIADSGGPMFRGYVDPSLTLLLELLLTSPSSEVQHCVGKCLQALITTIGPELQGTNSATVMARWSLLCGCALVQQNGDPYVQAEAVTCLQQMHMFAPRHVNLSSLVPMLVQKLSSDHLLLRRAAVSCLRQLAQREAWEVCHHALNMASEEFSIQVADAPHLTESGLPGLLFSLLDCESDAVLVSHAQQTLLFTLHAMAPTHLRMWLTLCREVLTNAQDSAAEIEAGEHTGDMGIDDEDLVQFHASIEPDPHPALPPRWTSRVFAAQCVAKIIQECDSDPAHYDLLQAREKQQRESGKADFLVLHLSELIRMGFMAATSDSDQLRMEGLNILQLVIDKFAESPEPEFPGHVILEQYQAQVGAALRPAFSPDTASHVTARACEVCSTWIGSGVARDLSDLKRVHQLLVSSLGKLNEASTEGLYNESAATLEKLAILKAWAEVYIVSQKGTLQNRYSNPSTVCDDDDESKSVNKVGTKEEDLSTLVNPELQGLASHWLAALKDHALLSLPPEFFSQLPHSGGAFYSNDAIDSVRPYYQHSWSPILYAAALWLTNASKRNVKKTTQDANANKEHVIKSVEKMNSEAVCRANDEEDIMDNDRFYLLLGIIVSCLCGRVSGTIGSDEDELLRVETCLQALNTLLQHPLPAALVACNTTLSIEIISLMQRQIVSSDRTVTHHQAISIVSAIVAAAQESLHRHKKAQHQGHEQSCSPECCEADLAGEGGDTGEISLPNSIVFAALQVCLCCLVRHEPGIAPSVVAAAPSLLSPPRHRPTVRLRHALLVLTQQLLTGLVDLCSPAGGVAVLPTILFLTTGLLRECSKLEEDRAVDASSRCSPLPPQHGSNFTLPLNTVVTQPQTTSITSLTSSHSSLSWCSTLSRSGRCWDDSPPLQAVYRSLASLCSHPYTRDQRSSEPWCRLLQCALATVIDCAKTCEEEREVCEGAVVRAIAEIVIHAPGQVTAPHNLRYPFINFCKAAVHHQDHAVRLSCVRTVSRIIGEADKELGSVFVQAVCPRLLYQLHTIASASETITGSELMLFDAVVDAVLLMFSHTLPQYKSELLSVLLSVLIMGLQPPSLSSTSETTALHKVALARLQSLAPMHPQEFRTVMSQRPELRTKLEAALRDQKEAEVAARSRSQPGAQRSAGALPHRPTITLKTDFSNFK